MGALGAGRVTKEYAPLTRERSYPMDALAQIWSGGIVCLDSTGYAVPGSTSTSLIAAGVAQESKLAGAVDGDTNISVHEGIFHLNTDTTFAQSAVGALCYVVDDQTVSLTSTSRSIAGTVAAVDSTGAWVAIGLEAAIDNTTLTAFESSLASTSNGAGAALIGIEDAGALYAGATVEAGMQEKIAGKRISVLADAALTPGILCVQTFAIADAASGHTDYVLALKQEIVGVSVQKRSTAGGSGDTITVGAGATAITNAIDINVADKTLVAVTTIDDAQSTIAAAGTLRITWAKSTNVACLVTIYSVLRS